MKSRSAFPVYVLLLLFPSLCGSIILMARDRHLTCSRSLSARAADSPFGITTTGSSGTGSNINVIYQRCNWTINPNAAKNISGVVTIQFLTTQNFVSNISLDLNKSSFNNSSLVVKYHGNTVSRSFPTTGNVNILNISLPVSIPINTVDSIEISYSGAPPAVNGQAEGYQQKTDSKGNRYVYTLSESYEDKDWWPCKADMQDRIDSMDINVSVPDGFRVATNGKFLDSSALSGGYRTFRYKLQYSIPSYLVALGIAQYRVYDRGTVNINGTQVPVWYFIFPTRTKSQYTAIVDALDMSMLELAAFSNVWGDYPFKNEKHGYYEFGWGGGMEHQSFSAMGASALSSWSTIAHELGHQWFGNKVTFSSWNHLWLAEGFARYSEVLAAELVPGLGRNPQTVRQSYRSSAMGASLGPYGAYIPAGYMESSNAMWNSVYGSTVYERGAMIVSSLRALMGDVKFFQACRNYLNDPDLAYGSATTEDLRDHFSAVAGSDLSEFFNDWVYRGGYPSYVINYGYNPLLTRLNVQVTSQSVNYAGSNSSHYSSPIVLKVSNASNTKDTTIVIYDMGNGNLGYAGNGISGTVSGGIISYDLSFVPASVTVDPTYMTMVTGTVSQLASLPSTILSFSNKSSGSQNNVELILSEDYNVSRVQLEKSLDGREFFNLGYMQLQNGPGLRMYILKDHSNTAGTMYYRARIEDTHGQIRYSSMIKYTRVQDEERFELHPSVVSSSCSVFIPASFGTAGELRILSLNGSVVKKYSQISGGIKTQIHLADLQNGVYWLQLVNSRSGIITRKFIKQN